MTSVAIVVPGIMGSELRLNGDVVWPGPLAALWRKPYGQMRELLHDDLVATDLIRTYAIFSVQYQALLDDLARCGFREDNNPRTLFTFPYDWRKRNEVAAEGLADRIDQVANVYANAGNAKISLIAHSMGGLVSRYYLESGLFTHRPGFNCVTRLITIGTPHRGASVALQRLLGLEKVLWLNKSQVLELVSDPRYPAAYQLLPPRGEPFAWNEGSESEYAQVDVYDEATAQQLALAPESLAAAKLFHGGLDFTKRPDHVRYFCFTGTQQRTVAYVRLLKDGAKLRVRGIELNGAGDGTVPVWSSALPGFQSLPVGGEHGTLYKNAELRRTLAVLLGAPGVLADRIEAVELSVRERVVEPVSRLHVILKFGPNIDDIDGELRVELASEPQPGTVVYQPVSVSPIRYQGLETETISVVLEAPQMPGPYRMAFYANGAQRPAGSDEFFVQTP